MKECCQPRRALTHNLLNTTQMPIQLSHQGRCSFPLKSILCRAMDSLSKHVVRNQSACHSSLTNTLPLFLNHTTFTLKYLGPVVQSVVSLTSSLKVILLTVLADLIYNILICFVEKMWVAFALQKLLTFFQQKVSAYLRITRCKF